MSFHSLPLPAAVSCGLSVFSLRQPVTNSLSAQGTSSEFEVVPNEQNSPPESGGQTRNMMVSGWQVPGTSHVSSLFQSPGPGSEAQGP